MAQLKLNVFGFLWLSAGKTADYLDDLVGLRRLAFPFKIAAGLWCKDRSRGLYQNGIFSLVVSGSFHKGFEGAQRVLAVSIDYKIVSNCEVVAGTKYYSGRKYRDCDQARK